MTIKGLKMAQDNLTLDLRHSNISIIEVLMISFSLAEVSMGATVISRNLLHRTNSGTHTRTCTHTDTYIHMHTHSYVYSKVKVRTNSYAT